MTNFPEPKDSKVGDRFFDDRSEQIDYQVFNEICSYCGGAADFYELPDGKLLWNCPVCDAFNEDYSERT